MSINLVARHQNAVIPAKAGIHFDFAFEGQGLTPAWSASLLRAAGMTIEGKS
jgi:hypothetical protein